jgi:Protein of unknown function (DUF3501)
MQPLTPDDLLPLEEFCGRRRELFEAHRRYVDRYRRVRIGPRATLLFENRQTLWFRVQEVLRLARLADPARVRAELAWYNRLLPAKGLLQAALLLEVEDEARLTEELAPWQVLADEHIALHAGEASAPGVLLTCRPEDRCIGAAHWVQFPVGDACRKELADFRKPAHFAITLPAYPHQGPPLSDEVRQSLLDDLALSDRDAA